jgi:hypothetical protein
MLSKQHNGLHILETFKDIKPFPEFKPDIISEINSLLQDKTFKDLLRSPVGFYLPSSAE